ncbi:HupE/UreJ family protein [Hahella aquimaris]|uniref:HupE/UreJ family protein n=1 Tax=Hahella sp. HNIBRBA332 TaxID=3015983 RepID=UPI00273C4805|nr:HupE/UreJ family protein [Hahella sp. HNIBRBA332]WLQ17075.1 HupE/UreJ family protein [Hahella sp. HNIBRBA332]
MSGFGLVFATLFVLLGVPAWAHQAGVTDTAVQIGASKVKVVYTAPEAELAADSVIASRSEAMTTLAGAGFQLHNDDRACALIDARSQTLEQIASRQFAMLYDCGSDIGVLTVRYLLLQNNAEHKNFVRIVLADRTATVVFDSERRTQEIPVAQSLQAWSKELTDDFMGDMGGASGMSQYSDYFMLGLEHIIFGFDHLLFLLGLLLLPLGWKQLAALITSFTVAHSITLAASVLNWVSPPMMWVEAGIALSIVYVALENLWELRGEPTAKALATRWKRRLLVTFSFGLIHGFGFSFILREIGLGDQMAGALMSFNVGVETGQIAIVTAAYALIYYAMKDWNLLRMARVGSLFVAAMGGYWLVERLVA